MWYNEYHMLLNAGLDPDELTTFFFSDYGLNYPEDGIYVLRETWQQKPDICRAFVRASLQGWLQAFSDPEQALDITMRNLKKAHITTNRIHQAWMLARMRDIMLPPGNGREMGHLDEEDFQRVIHGLSQQDGFQNAPSYQKFYQQPAVE
jgi:NitT/TauT family transport system substrate-binding protein